MYLQATGNSAHWINGKGGSELFKYVASTGDRIQVKVDLLNNTVEWLLVHPARGSIGKVSIPEGMRGKELYPALELRNDYSGTVTML